MTRESGNDLHEKTERKLFRIDEVLQNIMNDSLVLPSFQRDFVWPYQKIIALFDSIMLGFPISTFIFWNLEDVTISKKNWFSPFYKELTFRSTGKIVQDDQTQPKWAYQTKNVPIAVLDGQQRLTGLFVALYGTVLRKAKGRSSNGPDELELYLDLGSGANFLDDKGLAQNEDSDNMDEHSHTPMSFTSYYKFRWDTKKPGKNWFKIKDVHNLKDPRSRNFEIEKILQDVEPNILKKATGNLETLSKRLFEETHINTLILNQCEMNMALEIFIRFNSYGKPLEKADLVFSQIESRWPAAKDEIKQYLLKLNNAGKYNFDTLFIARLVLALFGSDKNIKETDINDTIVAELKENWPNVRRAIDRACRFLKGKGITDKRMLSSYTSIIPIIYSIYYNDGEVKNENDIKKYIYRALMMNIFSKKASTDLLLKLINSVKSKPNPNCLNIRDIEEKISEFRVTDGRIQDIIDREKSFTTQLILCLIENSSDMTDVSGSEYHQDHIHASALFDKEKPPKDVSKAGVSQAEWNKWKKIKNKLPNLRMLKNEANLSKSDKLLTECLDTTAKIKTFRDHFKLPSNLSLELKDFGKFYECREDRLKKTLREMLRK
jgi:uncharacterized protein with ParB-like and HNH nuclease domain